MYIDDFTKTYLTTFFFVNYTQKLTKIHTHFMSFDFDKLQFRDFFYIMQSQSVCYKK